MQRNDEKTLVETPLNINSPKSTDEYTLWRFFKSAIIDADHGNVMRGSDKSRDQLLDNTTLLSLAMTSKNTLEIFKPHLEKRFVEFLKIQADVKKLCLHIAAGEPEAEKMLTISPHLAPIRSTITTNKNTYENVSAMEFAFIIGGYMIGEQLFPNLSLPPDIAGKIQTQLSKKIAEVETQQLQFKPANFNSIAEAITSDQTLRNRGRVNTATKKALAKFIEDNLQPQIIKYGKPFIVENLDEGHRVLKEYSKSWNKQQHSFFLMSVLRPLKQRVEKCRQEEVSLFHKQALRAVY